MLYMSRVRVVEDFNARKDSRSAVNVHGSDLVVHPAHSLQGGIVVTQLKLTTSHVLLLEDGHAGLPVVLRKNRKRKMLWNFNQHFFGTV